MTAIRYARLMAAVTFAMSVVACGSGDDAPPPPPPDQSVGNYLQALPSWEQFSPPLAEPQDTKVDTVTESERLDFPVKDDDGKVIGVRSEQYSCTTTTYDLESTPEKIVMFSPDREVLWPGALIQGSSHKAKVGSIRPLTIRERAPIKVSIPSLATAGNFRLVENPDQANVNDAIGAMVGNATANSLVAPSSIQFTLRDYRNEESFALKADMSGKYLGFSASASADVKTKANEHTVMVYFLEKMFEVVVEPPQTPGAFFSAEFTRDKLDEQIAMGRMGPDNLPVYVSNIVYGRMMAFTFTSTYSSTDVAAALNAAYKGIVDVNFKLESEYETILSEGKIAITSVGGPSTATVAMIASGNWRDYFKPDQAAPLTSAYPISYTFRNLGDGSIAQVSESTDYEITECTPMNTAGFMLDSFETAANWPADNPVGGLPLTVSLGDAATPQSIFYGYEIARHNNFVNNNFFKYDVGYINSPNFNGDMSQYYRGEISFWFKPDEELLRSGITTRRHCYVRVIWILFIPIPIEECVTLQVPLSDREKLNVQVHDVLTYDDYTTADQLVLRGGGSTSFEVLTLTYNPINEHKRIPLEWSKRVVSLSNDDSAGQSLCVSEQHPASGKTLLRGCWLVEDRAATEYEIQYVLSKVTELKLRASYPVLAITKVCSVNPEPEAGCPSYVDSTDKIPLGYVGGYFDEIKITKPLVRF
jgi:hypothetical protein